VYRIRRFFCLLFVVIEWTAGVREEDERVLETTITSITDATAPPEHQ